MDNQYWTTGAVYFVTQSSPDINNMAADPQNTIR